MLNLIPVPLFDRTELQRRGGCQLGIATAERRSITASGEAHRCDTLCIPTRVYPTVLLANDPVQEMGMY